MANWYGASRSNYFKVKDEAKFREWAEGLGLVVIRSQHNPKLVGIHPNDYCDGEWPSVPEEEEDTDRFEQLSKHLVPGQVAILQAIGSEKLRYLTGRAVAVNSRGRQVTVSIDDIYTVAAKKFRMDATGITSACY